MWEELGLFLAVLFFIIAIGVLGAWVAGKVPNYVGISAIITIISSGAAFIYYGYHPEHGDSLLNALFAPFGKIWAKGVETSISSTTEGARNGASQAVAQTVERAAAAAAAAAAALTVSGTSFFSTTILPFITQLAAISGATPAGIAGGIISILVFYVATALDVVPPRGGSKRRA